MNETEQPRSSWLYTLLSWVVTILVPVALILSAVRALLFPWFPPFEYSMPGFPPDPYGFTKEDRLYWSGIAVDYLTNKEGIEFLGDLRFENQMPVYNERELRHMVDVKVAVKNALNVWKATLLLLTALGLWAGFGRWWSAYKHGLGRGGWLTFFLVIGVIVIVLLSFGVFFVAFHNVFFQPGTWMFYWTDTLIRLFPERFWRDIFIYVGVISALLGLLLAALTGSLKIRRKAPRTISD